MRLDIESKKNYGFRRVLNKILQSISKSSLLSGYLRARLQKLRGVKFDDVSTVFLGEDIFLEEEILETDNGFTFFNGFAFCNFAFCFDETDSFVEVGDFFNSFLRGGIGGSILLGSDSTVCFLLIVVSDVVFLVLDSGSSDSCFFDNPRFFFKDCV